MGIKDSISYIIIFFLLTKYREVWMREKEWKKTLGGKRNERRKTSYI